MDWQPAALPLVLIVRESDHRRGAIKSTLLPFAHCHHLARTPRASMCTKGPCAEVAG